MEHSPLIWFGHMALSLGAAVAFAAMGLISRKLAEALRTHQAWRLYFVSAGLSLLAPAGDILMQSEMVDVHTLFLGGALLLSLVPAWMHWHWLLLGKDQ